MKHIFQLLLWYVFIILSTIIYILKSDRKNKNKPLKRRRLTGTEEKYCSLVDIVSAELI
jgi:hypothetical protein